MPRPTSEALLISALVSVSQPYLAAEYNIAPEMLTAHQTEYRWLLSYPTVYGSPPSKEALLHQFPDFPWVDTSDVAYACGEIRYEHTRKELVKTIRAAAEAVSDGDIEDAISRMVAFVPVQSKQPMPNMLHDIAFLDEYDSPADAMPVPWRTAQGVTGGIRPGDLWYVAARLGQGKSWSLVNMVKTALLDGRKVCVFSLEMPKYQWLTRVHVALGAALGMDVDHIAMRDRVFDRVAYRKLVESIKDEVSGELFIHDLSRGRVTPGTVSAVAKDFELSVIDYVGLMSASAGSKAVDDWRVMASISNQLKEIANSSMSRIVAAAQINREGDTNSWKPPRTVNLAQSDALGQDADVVITHKQYSKKTMVYAVDKNRSGAAGVYYWTRYLPNIGRFEEITRDQADDTKKDEDDD